MAGCLSSCGGVFRNVLQRFQDAEVDGRLDLLRDTCPIPSASMVTGSAALRAWASSTAGSPRSASRGG
jgi:hypothetical protein